MAYMINPKGIEEGVIRLKDKAGIPNSYENSDWKIYQDWLEEDESNEPLEFNQEFLDAYEE